MKKILLLVCILGMYDLSFAQWTTGTNISNTNAGNVGIGASAPGEKLDVVGNIRAAKYAVSNGNITIGSGSSGYMRPYIGGTSEGSSLGLQLDAVRAANQSSLTGYSLGAIYLNTAFNATNGNLLMVANQDVGKFTINYAGSVGIGTLNPVRTLDVFSTTNPGITIGGSAANTVDRSVVFTNSANSVAGLVAVTPNTVGTNSAMGLYVGGASGEDDKMWILDNGNVGIGTATPQVAGTGYTGLDIRGGNAGASLILGTNSLPTYLYSNGEHFSIENTGFQAFRAGSTERMRITSNGNIGIGTSAPDSKLTVAGNIHSQEVKVTVNAGADFVFDKQYKLRSLAETEEFIAANNHLPEIASAEEMKKNGIELGEMNIKLLQKIEELTLHLIAMNKKLEKQDQKNIELQQEVNQLKSKP